MIKSKIIINSLLFYSSLYLPMDMSI